jgi:RNA polymerase primary sigma factor
MKQLVITAKVTNRQNESFNSYLKEVASIAVLTCEEEAKLTEKSSNGDEDAKQELIRRNLRFVISVAKQYSNSQNPLEDLVNEGNIGLIIAADKFKPEMGFKFISYAVWWIRKVIMEHLTKNGRMVRIPANKVNDLSKMDKRIQELEQTLGREAYAHELFGNGTDEYDFTELLNSYRMDSLDRDISGDEGDGTTLGEVLVDDSFGPTDMSLMTEDLKSEIHKLLNTLKPRDKEIMIALFGLDGSQERTLADVGQQFNISREMVRQIRQKSLERLRLRLEDTEILS